ncbi:saccharopine dehydrogenase C-terminal domain-containing protein [Citreimonas sp.]|uniref:saccharopine dehydrogenase C-terminal domain-containing protein n=1 Tax=Citreimonas sp. TaxID=3036715 RepID=UPI0035C868A6
MTIHWCGTGLSAVPGLRRLIEDGHDVMVWNRTEDKARAAVGDLTNRILSFAPEVVEPALAPGDVLVSMLPADWHVPLARAAIRKGAHFVSSSYIAPEMRALDDAAQKAGVALVNEVGLDPGIDHLMAHKLVADYKASGAFDPGHEIRFTSYCGGVPKEPNAMRYKFSWAPVGVLKALRSSSKSLRDGEVFEAARPWDALGTYDAPLDPPETFEVYPNRDSLPFMAEYGFGADWNVQQFVRGTLRLDGWAEAWRGIFAEMETADDARLAKIAEELLRDNAYAPGEADRVVLVVSLKAGPEDAPVWHKTYLMDAWGDERGNAMGRLVSVPVSLAVEAAARGDIAPGVSAAPSDPAMVDAWLERVGGLAQVLRVVDHVNG